MTLDGSDAPRGSVTALLRGWRGGDEAALDRLIPLVYGELRRLARGQMSGERKGHTLQTTALVHEAYTRLVDMDVAWKDRKHFFVIAARTMRRILIDHARALRSAKRGGAAVKLAASAVDPAVQPSSLTETIALDEALTRLAAIDERKCRAVELHYLAGLSYDEAASVLDVSPATLHRELRFSKAWLRRELEAQAPSA